MPASGFCSCRQSADSISIGANQTPLPSPRSGWLLEVVAEDA